MSDPSAPTHPGVRGVRRSDVLVLFGSRVSRDTAIYAAGTSMVLPFSLATVAVLTRHPDPADYGRLAVLFVFAGLLTTVYNLGSLQGTLAWVFGGSGDDVEADAGDEDDAGAGTRRRALSTGLAMTVAIALAASVPIALLAGPIGELLLGEPGQAELVRWAAASAAAGAVWRLVVNVFRMERRPGRFAALNLLRPALVFAASVWLVVSGHGIAGALAGAALGTAAAVVVCLIAGRRSYAWSVSRDDAARIVRLGSRVIAVVAALWVVHNADVFFLSRYASESEVGLYRLAGRVGAVLSYFVSAFLMAWTPLERTSLARGAYGRFGRPEVRSKLVTYYFVLALTLVVAMAVTSDLLVRIAAPSYADAAALIAPTALGFVAYGGFVLLARAAQVPRKRTIYAGAALGCAALFGAAGLVLIPWLGAYGAALTVIVSMGAGCAFFLVLIARSREPIPFEWGRLGGALALALAACAVVRWVAPEVGSWQAPLELATLGAFLGLVVALGVVPREHLQLLAGMARLAGPRRVSDRGLLAEVRELPADERLAIRRIARDRMSLRAAAESLAVAEESLGADAMRGMRRLAGWPESLPDDAAILAYLTSDEPPAERDAMARRLWKAGVDPLELDSLETLIRRLRAIPRRAW